MISSGEIRERTHYESLCPKLASYIYPAGQRGKQIGLRGLEHKGESTKRAFYSCHKNQEKEKVKKEEWPTGVHGRIVASHEKHICTSQVLSVLRFFKATGTFMKLVQ